MWPEPLRPTEQKMESQEPKTESKHVDVIEQHTPVHHEHVHHSQLHASHLFQEDKEGNVIGRLLIPRPTSDPRDPLVRRPAFDPFVCTGNPS